MTSLYLAKFTKTLITKTIFLVALSIKLLTNIGLAQDIMNWDDRSNTLWPSQARLIEIISSIDQSPQKCYLYKSSAQSKEPLIISLHTWGGNYAQRDPILKYCVEENVNYLHPDFRGPNNNPTAAGSYLAIQDIDDAIQWAIDSLRVDTEDIHIIGVSGGGFATVNSYMKTRHKIKSFHAFVGIYNLEDWYYESLQRNNNYANDILAITGTINNRPNPEEVKKRSPLLMKTPTKERLNTRLYLYAGLHDGYTGSVPISQSLELYNKIVRDFNKKAKDATISLNDMYTLLKRRSLPSFEIIKEGLLGRDILFQKNYKGLVEIIVFDGGHEMPNDNILKRILNLD